jgi:hypothetical protein
MSTSITSKLCSISTDLESRRKGALFSLNPKNPNALRHLITSAREIFIQILDDFAPDERILSRFPGCDKTYKVQSTRRWKISYIPLNPPLSGKLSTRFDPSTRGPNRRS